MAHPALCVLPSCECAQPQPYREQVEALAVEAGDRLVQTARPVAREVFVVRRQLREARPRLLGRRAKDTARGTNKQNEIARRARGQRALSCVCGELDRPGAVPEDAVDLVNLRVA